MFWYNLGAVADRKIVVCPRLFLSPIVKAQSLSGFGIS